MKKLALAALAASAAIASPAMAQTVSGTVNLNGTVAPKCLAVSEGAAATTFTRSVNFAELAQADGTLRTGLAGEFDGAVAAVRVVCTTAAPVISVNADPLAIQNATAPTSGYDNSIDYDAHVALTLTGGTTATKTNRTVDAPLVADPVGGRLAGSGSNLVITADNFRTNAATDILEAGAYSGQIAIVIAPGA
ncbi:hypothetical protein [Tsuneonella amylolytica]|uniref:hypothetical protein n=1 Tax=Tsuneonella amylolytica TaxID=2338327 RepID=UPI0013C4E603|nr:hypothetical protein [Tsuneonella amylolytica]